ncbi:hypothetical protein DAPPUDRAFT_116742 [Daphnia pulex]|uniref:Uncharacterized protein n=1 Tax=Daphnia pulex TaxID=6669 RepID=E9HQC8_DAPPU|nr:hypothetical protein DAPPUDRAFT_116742 [Daphnia pulex]|eukprot:EFX66033.1 hypothetical protein DAPPUDRAFT_116742 [Daphnia pulex]
MLSLKVATAAPKKAQIVKGHGSAAAPIQHLLGGSASRRSSSTALITNTLGYSACRPTPTPLASGSPSTAATSQDKIFTIASQRTTTPLAGSGRSVAAPIQHLLSGGSRFSESPIHHPIGACTSQKSPTPLTVCGRSSYSVVQVLPGVGSVRRLPEQRDPSHRSPERLGNQTVLVLNNSPQGDAVLRSMFKINKNFNSLNRK